MQHTSTQNCFSVSCNAVNIREPLKRNQLSHDSKAKQFQQLFEAGRWEKLRHILRHSTNICNFSEVFRKVNTTTQCKLRLAEPGVLHCTSHTTTSSFGKSLKSQAQLKQPKKTVVWWQHHATNQSNRHVNNNTHSFVMLPDSQSQYENLLTPSTAPLIQPPPGLRALFFP